MVLETFSSELVAYAVDRGSHITHKKEKVMKGLRIYSLIILGWSLIALLIEALERIEVSTNIWAIALYIPILVYVWKSGSIRSTIEQTK